MLAFESTGLVNLEAGSKPLVVCRFTTYHIEGSTEKFWLTYLLTYFLTYILTYLLTSFYTYLLSCLLIYLLNP